MKYFLIILSMSFSICLHGQEIDSCASVVPDDLVTLINDLGLEIVVGSRFPQPNPVGSYGSPYLSGILIENASSTSISNRAQVTPYTLILTREEIGCDEAKNCYWNLIHCYEYALVFAVRKAGKFEIVDVFKNLIGLEGMHFLYGKLDLKLENFVSLRTPQKNGPKNKSVTEVKSKPVIIPSENGVKILVFINGEWYLYKDSWD